MIVNPSVARFQHHAHVTVAQMQDILRTFQRVVGPSCQTHLSFLIEATRQRVDFLRSQGKPLLRALRQRLDEDLPRQSHLRLLATRAQDGVYAILLRSEPFLNRIRHLYCITKNQKTAPALIGAAIAGFALIILLLQMSRGNQANSEHAGTVNGDSLSLTHVPDWTIFDDAFSSQASPLATWEFADRVRTSGAALTRDPAETSGQVIRELVPLPRPRPKRP